MDQRAIIILLAVLVVLGLVWYSTQTPPSTTATAPEPAPATTPATPPSPPTP